MTAAPARLQRPLGWLGIVRLGLVQAALGSVVVLSISTLNRVMVVEYAWPAIFPGALVALHYAVQYTRARFGYRADRGGPITPWILGGMAVLAAGGILCAVATVLLPINPMLAVPLAIAAYALVGLGVSAAGTSLLVLVAARVEPARRAGAAAVIWILMIAGFAVTSSAVGRFLDPFSARRLVTIIAIVSLCALALTVGAVSGIGARGGAAASRGAAPRCGSSFLASVRAAWHEPQIRNFTLFVLISMLAYSAQELLFEPFAGLVFGLSLGASARLSGLWHAAVLAGMIAVGISCRGKWHDAALRFCTVAGCGASAAAITALSFASLVGPGWPLPACVIALGVSNGVFAVAAIGSMMMLAHRGGSQSAGLRMGLWGAAQAAGFACGGLLATMLLDAGRHWFGSEGKAFSAVFAFEALLFLTAALYAGRVNILQKRVYRMAAVANP
jgi:BCD family chlorophyll transporter-like MFS transporter